MRVGPSQELIDLLTRLELATAADLRRAARRARRLAGELTHFDSVWVDALVQVGKLTPYQAAEINAGRGGGLRVARFALLTPIAAPAWARAFDAQVVGGTAQRHSRLVTVNNCGSTADVAAALSLSIRKLSTCALPQLAPIVECGAEEATLWAASAPLVGRSAAEWLVHSGRMPPEVVLEIARQMAIGLLALERAGVPHGDISPYNLVLDPIGVARMTWPGLRSAVRELETAETADWPAEAYDHLAPERMRGAPASTAADIYSCGIVWRHLLSGRSPFAIARTSAKLCAAQTQKLEPIQHLAPDTPPALARAITACEARDPTKRPASAAALVELLGPSTDHGQTLVAQYLSRGETPPERFARRLRTIRGSSQLPTWSAVAAGVILAISLAASPWWAGRLFGSLAEPAGEAAQVAQASANSEAPRPGPIKGVAQSSKETTKQTSEQSAKQTADRQPRASSGAVATGSIQKHKQKSDPANRVMPAVATQPIAAPGPIRAAQGSPRAVSKEFVLSAGKPTAWSSVQPSAGQTVRGRPGERPTIVIPAAGAILNAEGVRFEQIDFVILPGGHAASLRVTARTASFDDCTFGGAPDGDSEGASLIWTPRAADGLPAAPAELHFTGGAFRGETASIRCSIEDEARLSLTDVLHLGSGPLVCVENTGRIKDPDPSASLALRLIHCTSRDAGALVEIDAAKIAGRTPRVRIEAVECAFALTSGGALLLVRGGTAPDDALRQIAWIGQGSVVTPGAAPVAWQNNGARRSIADNRLAIEGLVRSELGFAGEADAGREASQLVRWQVPLRSPNPPGISEAAARPSRKSLR